MGSRWSRKSSNWSERSNSLRHRAFVNSHDSTHRSFCQGTFERLNKREIICYRLTDRRLCLYRCVKTHSRKYCPWHGVCGWTNVNPCQLTPWLTSMMSTVTRCHMSNMSCSLTIESSSKTRDWGQNVYTITSVGECYVTNQTRWISKGGA